MSIKTEQTKTVTTKRKGRVAKEYVPTPKS